MSDNDTWTAEAMKKWGGSFVMKLGEAALRADPINLAKIKKTWPEYWKDYAKMGKKLKAEEGTEE